jgi:hypothetical protein
MYLGRAQVHLAFALLSWCNCEVAPRAYVSCFVFVGHRLWAIVLVVQNLAIAEVEGRSLP